MSGKVDGIGRADYSALACSDAESATGPQGFRGVEHGPRREATMTCSRACTWMLIAMLAPLAHAGEDFISPTALDAAGLTKFWQVQLPLEADQQLQNVYLVDDQLYLGTNDGWAFAVDAYSGAIRWLQQVTRSGYPVRRPTHADQKTIFVTPIDIQIYDRLTGDGLKRRALRFPAGTGGLCDGERLIIGGLDNRIYAFNMKTLLLDWRAIVDGPVSSTPAFFGDIVFVANEGGTVHSCLRKNKTPHWSRRASTFGPIVADVVVDDRGVYIASTDRSVYQFGLAGGNLRWRARLNAPLHEAPFVSEDLVYQYSRADGIAAIETGLDYQIEKRIRWTIPNGRLTLATDDETAYISAKTGDILAVRKSDGKVRNTIPAAGFTVGIPAHHAPILYVAMPDGKLFCARKRGVALPSRDQVNAALRPKPDTSGDEGIVEAPTTQPAEEETAATGKKKRGIPAGGKSKITQELERNQQAE